MCNSKAEKRPEGNGKYVFSALCVCVCVREAGCGGKGLANLKRKNMIGPNGCLVLK